MAAGRRCSLEDRKQRGCVSGSGRSQGFVVSVVRSSRILRVFSGSLDLAVPSLLLFLPLRCTELRSDLSGVPELRGRLEGFPPPPPAGVSPALAPPTEAPPGAAPRTPRVLRSTPRLLTEDSGTVLWPGSAVGPGGLETGAAGSADRCGAGAAVSGGLSPSVPPQLTTSR